MNSSSTPEERKPGAALPPWTRLLGAAGATLWATLIFIQSHSPSAGSFLARFPAGADKVAHAAAYSVFGAFLMLATRRVWLAVLIAFLFGISDEVHQYFVPNRSADVMDVVADVVGATLGATAVAVLLRRLRGPR